MNGLGMVFFGALFIVGSLSSPLLLTWGWVRWTRRPKERSLGSIFSLLSLFLATISALLAVSTVAYSLSIGGFRFYDPLLLKILRFGILISLFGTLLGLAGTGQSNCIRWQALASALAMLIFWIIASLGE